jgi:superfamily II RNA helicase
MFAPLRTRQQNPAHVSSLFQVSAALKGVGDTELAARFDEARAKIKRDVIFAASLYL